MVAAQRGQKLEQEHATVSISKLLNLWLKRKYKKNGKKLSDRTKADVKKTTETFIEWFGNKPAGCLTQQNFNDYIHHLEAKGYNETSQSMILRRLKSLFNWGFANNKIKNQPFRGLDIPAWKNRKSYLTKEEIKKVMQKAGETSLLHQQFLILLGSTGARLGEYSRLRWQDVNRKKREITFDGKVGARPFE